MGMYDTVYLRCPCCSEVNDEQIKHGPCMLKEWNGKTVPREVGAKMHGLEFSCPHCAKDYSLVWMEPCGPLLCVPDEHFAEVPEDPSEEDE